MALGASRFANMSSGLLLDPLPSPTAEHHNGGKPYTPFPSPDHHVTKARYITSNDPRGYIPVYEYPLNGQWIMLDMDDGYILWTGIWKALGNSKADIVKIIDSQPDLASQLRRVRGGYLKIQGTWMPYDIALRLARRVAWPIRYDLVPLFGPTFPGLCLPPDDPGYGQISKPGTGKRRARRNPPSEMPLDSRHDWAVFSPGDPGPPSMGPPSSRHTMVMSHTFATQPGRHIDAMGVRGPHGQGGSPVMLHVPYVERSHALATAPAQGGFVHGAARQMSPAPDASSLRYSPYPSPLSSTSSRFSGSSQAGSVVDISPTLARPPAGRALPSVGEPIITLPPIQPPSRRMSEDRGCVQLPPISTLDRLHETQCDEPMAVLRRLQAADDHSLPRARRALSAEQLQLTQRRHSLADQSRLLTSPDMSLFSGGARTHGPPTPVSAAAALSPSSHPSPAQLTRDYRLPRSAAETSPPSSFVHPARRTAPHAMPPSSSSASTSTSISSPSSFSSSYPEQSPEENASYSYRDRPDDDERYASERAALHSQGRPPSPPPSTSSASAGAASQSPSPSDARAGWRPW